MSHDDQQLDMLDLLGDRDGGTYEHGFDYDRLNAQAQRVYTCMHDGMWRSLAQIAHATGDPEASVSARLRDLRKPKFGGLIVERQRVNTGRGLWLYRLLHPEDT